MKKPTQHPIAEARRKLRQAELTIGIDLGDVWSHYCTLNQDGDIVAMEAGVRLTTLKACDSSPIRKTRIEVAQKSKFASDKVNRRSNRHHSYCCGS
jgi:hypothetical protein